MIKIKIMCFSYLLLTLELSAQDSSTHYSHVVGCVLSDLGIEFWETET